MTAVIIEDEINVRCGFIKLLNVFCEDVEIIGEASSVEEGLSVLSKVSPDLLFLDINLPDGSGFDLLHRMPERTFKTIFVTAYDQYAIDAFKISAVDYLLKPVSPDRLKEAISKAKIVDPIDKNETLSAVVSRINRQYSQSEKIILRDAESLHIVVISDIIYCTADGAYTVFHLEEGRTITTSLNLKEYERLLEPYGFVRCHHSYLANLQHLVEIKKADGGSVIMSDKTSLPLSTRKKTVVVDALKNWFVS